MVRPLALKTQSSPVEAPAPILIVSELPLASAICEAIVRFLRVLDFARVYAWLLRQVLRPVQLLDLSAGRVDCGLRQRYRVGSHISDEAVFIQSLRDLHRACRAVAEFARGFLLEGRRAERRVRAARVGLGFDRADRKCTVAQCVGERLSLIHISEPTRTY